MSNGTVSPCNKTMKLQFNIKRIKGMVVVVTGMAAKKPAILSSVKSLILCEGVKILVRMAADADVALL